MAKAFFFVNGKSLSFFVNGKSLFFSSEWQEPFSFQ